MSDVMIEAHGLGKRYGSFVALQDASFELRRGEILAFIGPNGAGKSTTMKILTCFIAPSTGSAKVNGCDIWEDPIGVRKSIGYLPENNPLYSEMLVLEYLEWVAQMRGLKGEKANKRILKVVEETGLEDVIAKTIRELSKGYRQRVGLAQALIHEPPILILDEPMSGLDPNQAFEIRELIREIGKLRTIILSTHNLAEVEVTCQRVLVIDKGRIVADDTPDALIHGATPRYKVSVVKANEALFSYRSPASSDRTPAQVFGAIPGVKTVRELTTTGEETRFEIITDGSRDDLREDIFAESVKAGLVVLTLESTRNLEQVFRDLTTDDAQLSSAGDEDDEDDEDLDEEDDDEEEEEASDDDDADDDADDEEEEEASDDDADDEEEEEEASDDGDADDEEEEEASDDDEEEDK